MSESRNVPNGEFFQQLSSDGAGYEKLAGWLKQHTGIHMPPTPKNYTLMASRLSRIMGKLGLRSYSAVYQQLQKGDRGVQKAFIEALTTNKTEFFRESHHFKVLLPIVPRILQKKGELRIWCAAASRGHEPYSLLFTLLEAGLDPHRHALKFLASDIDQSVLEAASKGVYRAEELTEVPSLLRDRYMVKMRDNGQGERWMVREEIRRLVTFACFNLVEFPYPFQHKFDIIFCRNVLIYFDREMVARVKDHLAQALAPEGYLFIGHSETGSGRVATLRSIETAVFQKLEEAS